MIGLHRPRAIPLRWRLTAIAALSTVVVLIAFGAVLYADLQDAMLVSTSDGMRTSAEPFITFRLGPRRASSSGETGAVATPAPPPAVTATPTSATTTARPSSENVPVLTDLARVLTARNISARTFDTEGQLVGDGPALMGLDSGGLPKLDPSVYQRVAESGNEDHFRVSTREGAVLVELIPLVRQTRQPPTTIGVLELSTSLRSIDEVLSHLKTLLVIGTLMAIGATVLLSVPLIGGALRPLRQMAVTSRAIAEGQIHRRVGVPRANDELADLAHAFNEMVARLEAILETQRHFLADASHELRSPLTALGGGVEMLMMGADQGDPAARSRLLQLMEGEVARMGRLIDDLLTLSRLDAQPDDALVIAQVNLSAMVTEVGEELRLLAPDRRVVVEVPVGQPVVISGDGDRLRQALLNLSANARAYTPPGGLIELSLRVEPRRVIITVTDTGTGIAPEDLPHVWDRFYRADPARSRSAGGGGIGLGLAIVRAIVEAHDGEIFIESEVGVGTTVRLILPGTSWPGSSRGTSAPRVLTGATAGDTR